MGPTLRGLLIVVVNPDIVDVFDLIEQEAKRGKSALSGGSLGAIASYMDSWSPHSDMSSLECHGVCK